VTARPRTVGAARGAAQPLGDPARGRISQPQETRLRISPQDQVPRAGSAGPAAGLAVGCHGEPAMPGDPPTQPVALQFASSLTPAAAYLHPYRTGLGTRVNKKNTETGEEES